jgi:dihydrodipicolinate synthase/N-acetylneuraminate lyase
MESPRAELRVATTLTCLAAERHEVLKAIVVEQRRRKKTLSPVGENHADRTCVAPLTPFTSTGAIDWPVLQAQIDYIVETCRTTHIVAAGVEAQEYQFLEPATRRELISRTVEYTRGGVPVMVRISHPDPRVCGELARLARDLGAATVQVLAPLRPFGGAPTNQDLLR